MTFATINPIATLIPPADAQAQPQPQPIADAAHTLCAQFAQPESTQARTRSIWDMARTLTCAEFDDAMSRALKMAAANDKAAGWTPGEGVTGRKAYGPSQSSLATVASQCRQVFGACKIDPECIVSLPQSGGVNPDLFPNWSRAYTLAREFLAEKGIDWQGNNVESMREARKTKAEASADSAVMAEVMQAHPKNPGESLADYMARIADDVGAHTLTKKAQAVEAAAQKELTRLIKVYGEGVADILEAMVHLHNIQADGEDASV